MKKSFFVEVNKNKYRIINKFALLIFFLILIVKINFRNISYIYNKYKICYTNENDDIIELNYYTEFDKIKTRLFKDSFFRPYLKEINILYYIYHKNTILKKNLTNIHICMSLNEKYLYPLLVSAESIIFNINTKKTFITYHILCTPDIKQTSILKMKCLIKKSLNIEIIFYNMGNNFMNHKYEHLSPAAYYRLLTPIFIDVNRLMHLDGDTLTLKDLGKVYQIEFNDNYVLGFLDYSKDCEKLEIRNEKYINDGVILLNMEKIRKDKKAYDLINMVINNTKLPKHDQTIINKVFYPNIGLLPFKYGIWNFKNKLDIINYSKRLKQNINITELEEAIKDPGILHNVRSIPKIWLKIYKYRFIKRNRKIEKNYFIKYYDLWQFYAKKNYFYDEMKKKF